MYIKRISSNTFRVWIDLPNDGTRNRPSKVFHATSKKDLTYQIEKWRDSISVIPSDCKTVNDLCLTVWEQVIADKAPNTIYGYNASLKLNDGAEMVYRSTKVRSTLYGYEQLGYEQSGRSAIENVADAFREVVFSSVSGYRNGAFRKIRRLNEQQTSGGTNGQGVLGDGNGTRERGKGKDHSIDRNVSRRTSDTENRGNEDQVGEKYSSEGNLVVQKNGIDHSLDLSTDTENAEVETEFEGMEDRGWDLPEALENQLIADLESSFVEEDSDGDIYVDGEAKKYAEVSLVE